MQVAGRPAGSTTQYCSHTSWKHGQLENINLQGLWGLDKMQHSRGLPGSNLAPSKTEGSGVREWGAGLERHRAPECSLLDTKHRVWLALHPLEDLCPLPAWHQQSRW